LGNFSLIEDIVQSKTYKFGRTKNVPVIFDSEASRRAAV
jgi:hypothetical protein